MFVYNVKFNSKKVFKIIFILMIILGLVFAGITVYKVIFKNSSSATSATYQIEPNNYTNVLKSVHDDLNTYIGQKINFTGYVYRVLDLQQNQFILARNMIISSDFQSVVVGFLCEYDNVKDFENDTWVELTGEIKKGNYHGNIPIVKVIDIKRVTKPNDEFVYPPNESYIPTNGIL